MPDYFNVKVNQGDDASGIVEAVGKNVHNFRKGDRVAVFHVMDTPRGTYAEYTVAPSNTVFHIPDSMSYEEAATIPLAAYTAAVGLFRNLRLPLPFERTDEKGAEGTDKIPLVINGAFSAVGAFAVKLAKLNSNIYPIVGVAGASAAFPEEVGVHVVVDYRGSDVAGEIGKALGGKKVAHVFDAANTKESVTYFVPVMAEKVRYTSTLPVGGGGIYGTGEQKAMLDKHGAWYEQVWVGSVHTDKPEGGSLFGRVMSAVFEESIKAGKFSGQPYEIVEVGLHGVREALEQQRYRKGGNNKKFVTRIADTEGL